MTTRPQDKLLAQIRDAGGSVLACRLTAYQFRSVDPLVREGFLKLVPCYSCNICRMNASRPTAPYWCGNTSVALRDATL